MNLHQRIKLVNSTNPYFGKDLKKAELANKFIGEGSSASSTNKYRIAADDLGNCGVYKHTDTVFVSVEGNRYERKLFPIVEVVLAVNAGVTFVTDDLPNRSRQYNLGERELAEFLSANGYKDNGGGVWRPTNQT